MTEDPTNPDEAAPAEAPAETPAETPVEAPTEAPAADAAVIEPATADAAGPDALQRERDDLYDRLLRKTAEFDNFRKRVERDRKDMIEWAAADLLSDLIGIVDDFDRALAADTPPEAQPYRAGLELIQRQLADLLKKRGVTPIDALGADFDPHVHQAVAYEEVAGAREGEVVGLLAKGYRLGDKLLRPAMVKVAKAS